MMHEEIAKRAYDSTVRHGGITVNLQGHEPSEGYAYSPFPELGKVIPANLFKPEHVQQYLDDNTLALTMPGNHLGTWHDQQSGNVFLDVSQVGPAHPDTVAAAKKANQIAVMDLSNFNEIPTGVTLDRKITTAADSQSVLNANAGRNLHGLPGPVNVPGHGPLQFQSHGDIQRLAHEYNAANGLGAHPAEYTRVQPETSKRIADEYERMPHNPSDPNVAHAYDSLARETRAQYDHAVKNGYNFEFYPKHDPYPNSPREAVLDLHHNKHMYVYPTEQGYGSEGQDTADHPLLGDSGVKWGGQPVTHNDLFRAVHDFYGHAKEGLGFRADGEDNAWRQHAAMFSEPARRALTAETRGQNSWVNYGPHGAHNQTATHDTVYAPQKAGLMPDWTMDPNLHRTSAWHFATIQINEIPSTKDNSKLNGGWGWAQQRKPFIYHPETGTIHIGDQGSHHGDLAQHLGVKWNHGHQGWINTRPDMMGPEQNSGEDHSKLGEPFVGWYGTPEPSHGKAVEQALTNRWPSVAAQFKGADPTPTKWEGFFGTFKQSNVTDVRSERPPTFPSSKVRPFMFNDEHAWLGDPGTEHYDIAKALGHDVSGYGGGDFANMTAMPSPVVKDPAARVPLTPGIIDSEGVWQYPGNHKLGPHHVQWLSQHLGTPLKMAVREPWERVFGHIEPDTESSSHRYTRGPSRHNLTSERTDGWQVVSWGNPNPSPLLPVVPEHRYNRFKDIMEAGRYHSADPQTLYLGDHAHDQHFYNRLTPQPVKGRTPYLQAQQWQPEQMAQMHQRYQQEARDQYVNNPESPYFDYENWVDWYGTHHPEHLGKTSEWQLPEDHGVLGPVHPEEFALNDPGQQKTKGECPSCHAYTSFPLGGCPHCGWSPHNAAMIWRNPQPQQRQVPQPQPVQPAPDPASLRGQEMHQETPQEAAARMHDLARRLELSGEAHSAELARTMAYGYERGITPVRPTPRVRPESAFYDQEQCPKCQQEHPINEPCPVPTKRFLNVGWPQPFHRPPANPQELASHHWLDRGLGNPWESAVKLPPFVIPTVTETKIGPIKPKTSANVGDYPAPSPANVGDYPANNTPATPANTPLPTIHSGAGVWSYAHVSHKVPAIGSLNPMCVSYSEHTTPLEELRHSIALHTWDADAMSHAFTVSRPSLRELPTSNSIREPHDSAVEHREVFSTNGVPPGWSEKDWAGLQDDVPPDKLYHFAPPGSDRSRGIPPTQLGSHINQLGSGVYMYGYDPSHMHDKNAGDLYEIDARGLEGLTPDYDIDQAWHHPGPIPPERVKRIASSDSASDLPDVFSSIPAPRITETPHGDDHQVYGDHGLDRPFVWYPEDAELYMGPSGGWHDDVLTHMRAHTKSYDAVHGRTDGITHSLFDYNTDEEYHDVLGQALGTKPDQGTWQQMFSRIGSHKDYSQRSAPVIQVDGKQYWGEPNELHAEVAAEHGLDHDQVMRSTFGLSDTRKPDSIRWVAGPEDMPYRLESEGDLWNEHGPKGWDQVFGSHKKEAAGNTPYQEGDPIEPWEPGHEGKGMIIHGKPVAWKLNDQWGGPHHGDVLHHYDPSEQHGEGYFHIGPDGTVQSEGPIGDLQGFVAHDPRLKLSPYMQGWADMFKSGSYKDASEEPTVVQGQRPAERSLFPNDTPYWAGVPSRVGEAPVVWHHPSDTIYVGQKGTHHADLIDEFGLDKDEYQDPQQIGAEDSPYQWTSEQIGGPEGDHLEHMTYGLITPTPSGRGLHQWGHFPEIGKQALVNAGHLDGTYVEPQHWENMFSKVAIEIPGEKPTVMDWRYEWGNGRVANWEVDANPGAFGEPGNRPLHPFNHDITSWRPGYQGKGAVSPEGRAYAWETTEEHDGRPSHGEALSHLGFGEGEDSNTNAAIVKNWSFYNISHGGQATRLVGPNEHEKIMKAHLPQEPRCDGCGEPVEVKEGGMYDCQNCRWSGIRHEEPDNWGSMFAAVDRGPTFQWYDQGELDPHKGKDYQGDHSFHYEPASDTIHIGTEPMQHGDIADQVEGRGITNDLYPGWVYDQAFGSKLAPEQHNRLYDVFNRMHNKTFGEHLVNEKGQGWGEVFGINSNPDDATLDPDDMTDEQYDAMQQEEYDIRDPYAQFDHSAPIRKVHFAPQKLHREPDLYNESPSDDARVLKEFKDYEEPDAPVVFDGKRFYQGPANAYHWELIHHDPDLKKHFDMEQYMQKNPLNAANPESRKGMAYGRFNPATESVSWYHRGRFHPEKFDQLVNETYGNPYDDSEDMGMPGKQEQWQNLFSKVDAEPRDAEPDKPDEEIPNPILEGLNNLTAAIKLGIERDENNRIASVEASSPEKSTRRRLIIRRDENNRIASIEEETVDGD